MKIRGFKAVFPNQKLIPSVKTFTDNVKKDYQSLRKNGLFKYEKEEGLFVYKIHYNGKEHLGIVCSTDVRSLQDGSIQRHEHTLAEKEQIMIQLVLQRNAMVKPVLLTYPKKESISKFLNKIVSKKKPSIHIEYSAEEKHSFWSLTKKENDDLVGMFSKEVEKTMIADGHHRCSTNLLMHNSSEDKRKYKKLFAAIFSNDQLSVMDFNRVINLKAMIRPITFMAKISKYCEIKPIKKGTKPSKTHVITMYLQKEWYELKWKGKYIKKSRDTDPALFNDLILTKILGVEDIRTDTRIKYLSGEVPLEKLISTTDSIEEAVGFCIYPLDIEYINSVVKKGQTLPPKSSYFVPRLRNGIINLDFELEYA